ncbi:MerR family transcriptional regulator [Actinomadura kijaniata]|uniref:MerR family transcriptional regulator n=1 Tax=Actinomadura kijaniata TaxID=46161 RepID=UPI003F1BE471
MDEELLPIGRFARLCRLSVKRLRHYDEIGLLRPARVDAASGYRYYRREQARDAFVIGLLRSLDVPLPVVARVLEGEAGDALRQARDRMEAELARRRRALAALDRVLAEGLPAPRVELCDEPARRVRTVRDLATPDSVAAVTSACVARALDGPPPGLMAGLFPLDMRDEFPVTVAVEDPAGAEVLDGGRFAAAVHLGPYEQIPLTVHAVLAWCGEHGFTPVGPVREVYLDDPASVPVEALATRIMVGVAER